jgi:hypothetical protein
LGIDIPQTQVKSTVSHAHTTPPVQPEHYRLHLVDDSTMATKTNLAYPERGWGQLLPEFMLPALTIVNHAANGRSTQRFLNEGLYQQFPTGKVDNTHLPLQGASWIAQLFVRDLQAQQPPLAALI